MAPCVFQRNNFAAREDIWGSTAGLGKSAEIKETVVCPKPRRLSQTHPIPFESSAIRTLRWHVSHQQEICDAKANDELMDIIRSKGGCDADQSIPQVASSPPFFTGSPPSRVSNPLIQDVRFRDEKFNPLPPKAILTPSGLAPSPTSSTHKGGCVRENFGNNPVARIEGFDCLDRDRRNCTVPALA